MWWVEIAATAVALSWLYCAECALLDIDVPEWIDDVLSLPVVLVMIVLLIVGWPWAWLAQADQERRKRKLP